MSRSPSLGAIFLTIFLDLLGFGLVLPFLADEARAAFGVSTFVGSLLASIYSLMQFLFVPVWGRISDRVGRRPVLLWSIAATAVGMSSLGFSLVFGHAVIWLFLARAFSGMATANLGVASAYIADVTSPADRARGMGMIGMAFGLGFILGPAVGGSLAEITILGRHGAVPCFVAGALSLVNLTWAFFGLGESLPTEKRSGTTRSLSPLNIEAARTAFAKPGVAFAVLVNFIAVLSFTNLDQTFRFFNADLFQMSQKQTGFALAFIGIVAAVVQGGMIRPLSRRFGDSRLIRVGIGIQAVAFGMLVVSPSFGMWFLFVSGAVLALGNGLAQPSVSAFISKKASASEQGATLGTSQSAASLARMFGPAMGGFLYTAAGPRSPYLTASIGMAIALLLATRLVDSEPAL